MKGRKPARAQAPLIATLEAARAYLAAGLGLLPIRADGSKAPDLPKGHQFLKRRTTDADLVRWFGSGARGIGIPGGKVSGSLECLDFELLEVFESWRELVEAQLLGLVERLCLVETPGRYGQPGMHARYRCTATVIPGSMGLAFGPDLDEWGEPALDQHGKPRPRLLIETRGEGGYAVAPPSPPGCHETGRTWRHVGGPPLTDLPDLIELEREVLIASARACNCWVAERDRQAKASRARADWPGLPGDDYNQRGPDWTGILLPHGWQVVRTAGEVRYWRRPGKANGMWSATTGHCRVDGIDLLHVFSGNAWPFEAGGSYSKWRAFALLNYRGNYRAAARALREQGYGSQHDLGQPPAQAAAHEGNGRATAEAREPELIVPEPLPWPKPPSELAYHGLAGEIVRLIEPQTEADPVAVLAQFLTMFGSAIGRKKYWEVEDTRHFGNLYCCLVGETAKGRKGTAAARAMRVFDRLQCGWHDRVVSGLSSGEGLIKALRDEVWQKHRTRRGEEVEESDVLIDEGVKDKRLLAVEPEFGRVLRVMQREGNTLSALLRQGWDSDRLSSLTKNGMTATGVHLSAIAHVTKLELLRLLGDVEAANGLANRFLWLAVRRSKLLPFGGERLDLGPKAHKVALAVEQAQRGHCLEIPFDPEAASLWGDRLYGELTADCPGIVGAVTNRAESQVRRLALLYALLDFDVAVREPHLLAALALWDYCSRSARWVFGESTGNSRADEILEAVRAAGKQGFTKKQVRDLFGRNESNGNLGQALRLLLDAELIRAEKVATGGRPAETFFAAELTTETTETTEVAP